MKKLILVLALLLLTVAVHAEEQLAIIIRANYAFGDEFTNSKELTTLLNHDWHVTSITTGSGNASTYSYWLVILKK